MAQKRTSIHAKTEGARGEHEDWWTLIVDEETGEKSVEHEWSHVDGYGRGNPDSGTIVVSVDEFLAGTADATIKTKLKAML